MCAAELFLLKTRHPSQPLTRSNLEVFKSYSVIPTLNLWLSKTKQILSSSSVRLISQNYAAISVHFPIHSSPHHAEGCSLRF
uniref:Uncharacterized protein n=1 Tax=Noccaea caerulescens TaxID=107243 RepID=A0A1J3HRZ2_NOCCA